MLSSIIIDLIIKNSNIFTQLKLKSSNKICENMIIIKKINDNILSDKISNKILLKYKKIKKLNINFNKIITDKGIKKLINLTHLNCYDTKITNEGIKNLVNLKYLYCSWTKITENKLSAPVDLHRFYRRATIKAKIETFKQRLLSLREGVTGERQRNE